MGTLNYAERIILENILEMKAGFLLSFSNREFAELFKAVLNVEIYSDKYAVGGNSKASRMRTFWDLHPDSDIALILGNIGDLYLENQPEGPLGRKKLLKIIDRLELSSPKSTLNVGQDEKAWEAGKVRLFISHKDSQRLVAKSLSEKLSPLGINGFVARESITPHSKWREELIRSLKTMDAFFTYPI